MSLLPVVITQDEVIDLTMEDTDDETMDKSLHHNSTTTHKGKEKLNLQASTPSKKLIQKDLYYFIQVQKSTTKKKYDLHKKKKKSTKKSKHASKLPMDNTTLTQIYKPSK